MILQSAGNDVLVESEGPFSFGTDPDVVALPDGRLLVVWTEILNQPTDTSDDMDGAIFARILNGDGTPDGDIFQVNDAQTFVQDRPHVVVLPGGGFSIGWTTNARYGDLPEESDTFVKIYSESGGALIESEAYDIVKDQPAPGTASDNSDDQSLKEMVVLDNDLIAMALEDGGLYLFNTASKTTTWLDGGVTDIAKLDNGNIIRAGNDGQEVRLVLTNDKFGTPGGMSGIYAPLTFYLTGSSDPSATIGEVELAGLRGGGFAVAFAEKTSGTASIIRLNILGDEAQKEFTGANLPRQYEFDSPVAEFDMISLSNGGFALALVVADSGGLTTGIEIRLYNGDGTLATRMRATQSDSGNQANPGLTQMPDGTVVLAYTDVSDPVTAGETNGMRLAFFDIDGESGRFVGSAGDDFLGGVAGNDRILGLDGNDEIKGRDGNDRLFGGDGNDLLDGGNGRDALRGGAGDDKLKGGNGNDGLSGGEGADKLIGGAGRDVLGGGAGDDILRGGNGNDVLKGGNGADQLKGGDGNDVLKGNRGDDQLTGGDGADVFVFVRGKGGNDTVTDFIAAEDSIAIHLRGLEETDVGVANDGVDTQISYGTEMITLEGVALAEADITFEYI